MNWTYLISRDDIIGGELEIHNGIMITRAEITGVRLCLGGEILFTLTNGQQSQIIFENWQDCPISSFVLTATISPPSQLKSGVIYFSIGETSFGLLHLKPIEISAI